MASSSEMLLRSAQSFGVAGCLSEDAEVIYTTLFGVHHLGRVSDLLSAKVRALGIDELKFRALVTLDVFQAKASGPVVIEIGIDSDRVAVGVCFKVGDTLSFNADGVVERIVEAVPEGEVEAFLKNGYLFSDQQYIRYHAAEKKIESVSILLVSRVTTAKSPPELILIEEKLLETTPKPKTYTNIADMDFGNLLRLDPNESVHTEQEKVPEKKSGGLFGRLFKAKPTEEANEVTRLTGAKAKEIEERVLKGEPEEDPDQLIRLKGSKADDADRSIWKVKNLFKAARSGLQEILVSTAKNDENSQKSDQELGAGREKNKEETQDQVESVVVDDTDNSYRNDAEPEVESERLRKAVSEGELSRCLEVLKGEAKEISENPRMRKLIDLLTNRLNAERQRLAEMTEKIESSVQKKKAEYRRQLSHLEDEIRRKDEHLERKNSELSRTREELREVTEEMQRLKDSAPDQEGPASFKDKFLLTQKMLVASKEEKQKLTTRLDEVRKELATAQASLRSGRPVAQVRSSSGVPTFEHAALREKYEISARNLDELKKANRQLLENLNAAKVEAKQARSARSEQTDDLRRRLESAMRLTASSRKEVDDMKRRIELAHQTESKLKIEVLRLQGELKRVSTQTAPTPAPISHNEGSSGESGGSGEGTAA